jgi:phosphoglucosamine mutase
MRAGGFNFGGEQSGHLLFLEHASTGDGIVGALQVLEMMLAESRPLSELAAEVMERVPQILENVTLAERRPLDEMRALAQAKAKIEKELGKAGRLLVRWSGTEPKLRILVEGEDPARIALFAKELAEAAQKDSAPRGLNGKAEPPRSPKKRVSERRVTSR